MELFDILSAEICDREICDREICAKVVRIPILLPNPTI
jgi:hypothetical protein